MSPAVNPADNLLERSAQLGALDGWLREAASGQGRLVLIGGEAGAGKSTLVDHFCQTAGGRARVLRGACDALSTPRPLGPLLDIADETGGELERLLNQEMPRDRVFRAALAELSGSLLPALVVIEDAHWADEATLDLLRFLGRRIENARGVVLVTFRDDEVGPRHPLRLLLGDLATTKTLRRLSLPPLSLEAMRILAAGSSIDPATLYSLTCGNPFFAGEVLAAGCLDGIPAAVNDAVLARVSRLDQATRRTLDAAAVIGSPLDAGVLAAVAGAAAESIETCLESGVLAAHGEHAFTFRHELARAAVYASISPPRRRALHERVLAVLTVAAPAPDLARLAHHAEEAGDAEAVLRYAPSAARQADSLGAHREAAAQYARALRFAGGLAPLERVKLLEGRAYQCYLTDCVVEAIGLQREAVDIWRASGDRLQEGDALRRLSRFFWLGGRNDAAVAAAEEALAMLAALPAARELAMALSNRSQLHMLAFEPDGAIELGQRAIALAQSLGETEILTHALTNVGTALLQQGDERGQAVLEQSLALAQAAEFEEHVARAWTNLSSASLHRLDLPRAAAYLADGLAYTEDHDIDAWRLYLLASRAELHLLSGDWAAATADAAHVLDRPDAAPVSRIMALTVRGLVRARRGDPAAGEPLNEALALADATGEILRLRPVRVARAEAAWLAGDPTLAAAEVRSILALALRRGSPWDIGEVFFWLRLAQASEAARTRLPDGDVPDAYRRALSGDWAGAAAAWDALGCPYHAALSLLDGDEAAVRRALAIFEQLGARPAAARGARRLRVLGARGVPRGPRPTTRANPANLTSRELEILSLLATGRRNAEIAEALFLSPKTVDHHVGRVLAKLGVHSRAAAVAAAARLGLSRLPMPDQEENTAPPN